MSVEKSKLIELGVRVEEAKINLQDVCVYLKDFGKTDELAVAELVLENVKALRVRYMSWASEKFGLGLNDAVLEAVGVCHHREPRVSVAQAIESAVTSIGSGR